MESCRSLSAPEDRFHWNQQAVDLSGMSSRMSEKNIACTGTIRLSRPGDCPVNKDAEDSKATFDFDISCISFAEPLTDFS